MTVIYVIMVILIFILFYMTIEMNLPKHYSGYCLEDEDVLVLKLFFALAGFFNLVLLILMYLIEDYLPSTILLLCVPMSLHIIAHLIFFTGEGICKLEHPFIGYLVMSLGKSVYGLTWLAFICFYAFLPVIAFLMY